MTKSVTPLSRSAVERSKPTDTFHAQAGAAGLGVAQASVVQAPDIAPRKFYHSWRFILNLLRFSDAIAVIGSGCLAYALRFNTWQPGPHELAFLYFGAIATVVGLQIAGAYRRRMLGKLGDQLSALFAGGVGALFIELFGGFFTGSLNNYSRVWLVAAVLICATWLILNRVMVNLLFRRFVVQGYLREKVVLVGASDRAEKIIANLGQNANPEVALLGLFDDRMTRVAPTLGGYPVLGTIEDLLNYVRTYQVDRVVVTLPWSASERIPELLKKLHTVPVRIDLVPHDLVWHFAAIGMERLAGIPYITVVNSRLDDQIGLLKRIEDIVLSIVLLLLASPVMLLTALAIRLDSPGPILFRQKRHGFNNQVFDVFKFRSMHYHQQPETKVNQATRGDPRITRVGRFLRRTSLDELPQLLNVLNGTMSVVGPRPHAVSHNIQYAGVIEEYFARHNVKPGITGWAQINGLRGETDTDEKMRKRVEYDLHYIENWSLFLDLKIVLMTSIVLVLPQENAY